MCRSTFRRRRRLSGEHSYKGKANISIRFTEIPTWGGGGEKEQQGPGIEIDMKSLILPQMLAHGPTQATGGIVKFETDERSTRGFFCFCEIFGVGGRRLAVGTSDPNGSPPLCSDKTFYKLFCICEISFVFCQKIYIHIFETNLAWLIQNNF